MTASWYACAAAAGAGKHWRFEAKRQSHRKVRPHSVSSCNAGFNQRANAPRPCFRDEQLVQQHRQLVERQHSFHHERVGVSLGIRVSLDIQLLKRFVLQQPPETDKDCKTLLRHVGGELVTYCLVPIDVNGSGVRPSTRRSASCAVKMLPEASIASAMHMNPKRES